MKRSIARRTGAAVLAGVIVLGVSGVPAGAQGGPFDALQKARKVADHASQRTDDMNARVGITAGTPAPKQEPARVQEPAQEPRVVSAAATRHEQRSRATKSYDPASHRDPFEPPTIAVENDETPRTPLERYEIGQLRLVGVVWGGPNSRAMVEDSAGLGYIVTQGTPIGSSGGFVRNIEPTRVLIEESVTNFYGEQEPREVVMELPQEDVSP